MPEFTWKGPGKPYYDVWRKQMNAAHRRRAHFNSEPRWKDLRPYVQKVWNDFAEALDAETV